MIGKLYRDGDILSDFTLLCEGKYHDLYEYVPDLYATFADKSNAALIELRKGIPTWLPEEIYRKMNISVWVENKLNVNAFACYNEGSNYIVLTAGLFYEFGKIVDEFVDHENFSKVFKLSEKSKPLFKDTLFFYMLNFAIAHEFGHIALGHLKSAQIDYFLSEALDPSTDGNDNAANWITQLKEYGADSFAVKLQSSFFLKQWQDDMTSNLALFDTMFISNYLCFRVFAEKMGRSFDEYISKEIYELDHPHPGIRMYYASMIYADQIGRYCSNTKELVDIVWSGSDAVISYEKNVLEKKEIKSCYYTIGFTEKACQHILRLHNEWQEMIDYYNKFAYFHIEKAGIIESLPFSLSMNGEPIISE